MDQAGPLDGSIDTMSFDDAARTPNAEHTNVLTVVLAPVRGSYA
jgi:hypothetical protein